MSNRLSAHVRVPIVPGHVRARDSARFRETQERAEYVMELGHAFGDVLRAIGKGFVWVDRRVDEAAAVRELARMNDRMLADIGLKRTDIPLIAGGEDVNELPRAA